MKVSSTRLILQKIGELGTITLDSFFPRRYWYTRISRPLFGLDDFPAVSPQTVTTLLSRLRRQGLIIRQGKRGDSSWRLSKKGKHWFEKNRRLSLPKNPDPDGITRLVIFDIPERERGKRDAVRAELIEYNFQMLQRSVWIGHNPLPEEFILWLDSMNLKKKVHIFSVREPGTIEE